MFKDLLEGIQEIFEEASKLNGRAEDPLLVLESRAAYERDRINERQRLDYWRSKHDPAKRERAAASRRRYYERLKADPARSARQRERISETRARRRAVRRAR